MTSERIVDLPVLPPRDPSGHKGTFGSVLVVGGHVARTAAVADRTMLGAPAFAAAAALRAGAGLAAIATPEPLLVAALSIAPAATGVPLPLDRMGLLDASGAAERIDAALGPRSVLVVGPGFGTGVREEQVVVRLLAGGEHPVVLDADGLNILAALVASARDGARDIRCPLVATPHPGEWRRLADALSIDGDPVDPDARPEAAAALARRLGCVVVLKGRDTVVSDGLRSWTNATGNASLATGGTGDVLAGVVGGIVAQFVRSSPGVHGGVSLFDAARIAVRLHGLAADRWRELHGDAGLSPEELVACLPDALRLERERCAVRP
jgi:NAD(P)H-hydrate epimerase